MTAKKQAKSAAEEGTRAYCGPTIPGVAKQFTFYRGGVREALEAQKQHPVLGGLIVPLEQLPEAMEQLRKKTGPIYALYLKAQARN